MNNLIKVLLDQHYHIKETITKLKDIRLNKSQKLELFAKFKELSTEHIKSEDTYLYPLLINTAKTDNGLKQKLELFAKDWEEVSANTKKYFDRYENGNFDADFPKETGQYLANMKQRMMKEEISLFSEYDKLIKMKIK